MRSEVIFHDKCDEKKEKKRRKIVRKISSRTRAVSRVL